MFYAATAIIINVYKKMCPFDVCFPKQNQSPLGAQLSQHKDSSQGIENDLCGAVWVSWPPSCSTVSCLCKDPAVFAAWRKRRVFFSWSRAVAAFGSNSLGASVKIETASFGASTVRCFCKCWPKWHVHQPWLVLAVWSRTYFFWLADICSGDYTISCFYVV